MPKQSIRKQLEQQLERTEFERDYAYGHIGIVEGEQILSNLKKEIEKEWLVEKTNETYRQMSFAEFEEALSKNALDI